MIGSAGTRWRNNFMTSMAAPSNVMIVVLKSTDGSVLEHGTALSHLPTSAITNEFAYNRFAPGPFGLRAQMGAMATITPPAVASGADTASLHSAATLQLRTVTAMHSTSPSERTKVEKKAPLAVGCASVRN
jgi:hypothetical protein